MRIVWAESALNALMEDAGIEALNVAAGHALKAQRRLCPVSTDGEDHMRNALDIRDGMREGGPSREVGIFEADMQTRALVMEFGSRAHPIDSTGPWPLRNKHGTVFGPHVDHPGTQAQPFLRPSLDDIPDVIG